MTNKDNPITQKISAERNKAIWLIKKDGKVIESFRQKSLAIKYKKRLEKEYFDELTLERDNSIRRNLIWIKK